MASDSHDSHRKHHRTPSDDDSPENSKRHKHRRHKRHTHHHRHKSTKHDDSKKDAIDIENRDDDVTNRLPPPLVGYDDMEEGEIVESEVKAVEKTESDAESGEFKAADDYYMSVDDGLESNGKNSSMYLKSTRSDQSDDSKEDGSYSGHDEFPVLEKRENGDLAGMSSKEESKSHSKHRSPVKKSGKEKFQRRTVSKEQVLESMEVDETDHGSRRHSYFHKDRKDHQEALHHASSRGRYHLEAISDKSRSESPDQTWERERSQSIVHDERLYSNGKVDDEKYRVNGREKAKEKEERSSSHHRSSVCEGKHEDRDSRDKEKEVKMYWDKKRVERESSKDRRGRDWVSERDRIRSRDHEWEKDPCRDRESSRETKYNFDWNRDRGRSRDRDLEREREKERRDRGRSRDRDFEMERRRESRDNSISMYKDRDAEREGDKLRDRSRKSDMNRGKDKYSDRDKHRDKARDDESDRSRRYHKYDDRDDANRDRRRAYDEAEYFKDRKSKHNPEKDQASKVYSQKENADEINGDDEKDYEETLELKPVEHEEDDVERIKEESRRRREAILQKYKAKPLQQQALPQGLKVSDEDEELAEQPFEKLASASVAQEENNHVKLCNQDASVVESSSNSATSALAKHTTAAERITDMLGEGSPKSERSNDMFCDDIFGDSPAEVRKMGKGDGLPLERSGLHDNWDDPEGYYSFRFGEILDSRYEITAAHGKGVFSTVVRAKDLKAGSGDPEEVAIKIIRNNETMLKAGTEELVILKKLVGADPDDRRHCVRYLSNFKYRNHLCIVFESLHMNLREVLKKFGRNIGLKLTAVRTYAKQLFIALKHLRNCGVLHCDIKPDNMLVNDSKNVLKLCDFGNAMFAGKNEITPYLVSRFYRAPEIILGLPYDHPMDIWSVGCCLYELYTGKVLFPGPSNNDMLRLHMELKGPFPKKMLRKGAFIEQHFDQDLNFLATEEDPVTKKSIRKLIVNIKPKDVGNIIRGSPGEDPKMLANFKDLLDKIFALDPDKRLTVSQALNHPFITGK